MITKRAGHSHARLPPETNNFAALTTRNAIPVSSKVSRFGTLEIVELGLRLCHLANKTMAPVSRGQVVRSVIDFLPGLKAGDSFYAAHGDASAIGWVGASQPAATARVD